MLELTTVDVEQEHAVGRRWEKKWKMQLLGEEWKMQLLGEEWKMRPSQIGKNKEIEKGREDRRD